jgi:hypothetical protein
LQWTGKSTPTEIYGPYGTARIVEGRGADLFVCEVMAQSVHDEMMERAKADAAAGNRTAFRGTSPRRTRRLRSSAAWPRKRT